MKSPLIIISTAITVLLIATGVGYLLLNNLPPIEYPPPVESPPRGIPSIKQPVPAKQSKLQSTESAPSFEQKIENLRKAMADVCATGESKEVTLVFTEAEANNQAAKLLARAEMPADMPLEIESVHIDFRSGNNVLAEARSVIYKRFKVTIKVMTQVSIEEGKSKVGITKASFGFVPLPQLLKDKIVGLVTARINDLQSQLTEAEISCNGKVDLEFKDINIQQEELTVIVVIERRA